MSFYNTKSKSNKTLYLSPEETLATGNTVNCILKEGKLMARQGIFARAEEWIFDNYSNFTAEMSLIVTDCFLYVDGKYARVAVSVADNETGNVEYGMRLVFADGTVRDIGAVRFSRASAENFGVPVSFTVFSGTAVSGSGIYFISRQVYGSGEPDFVRILELNSEMTNWYPVSESSIYSPVILANGRGDSYHLASPQGEGLKLKEPVYPESRNLLGGGFRCYFTADSASSVFSLPYSALDSGAVYGEYTKGDNIYSFKVEAGKTVSDEVKIEGASVKMECNRTTGKVYFKEADGAAWAPQYTGNYNNIKIRASKSFAEDRINVAAMSACCRVGGDAGRGESKVTVFYKNGISPAAVMLNSPKHPLYFPEEALQILGEPQLRILGMVMKDRSLVAFKENEVYAAEAEGYYGSLVSEPSKEGEKSGDNGYGIVFKRISALEAVPCENTFATLGRDIYYTSRRGDIMRIYGSGTSVYKTEKILSTENGLRKEAFAVADRGRYLLIEGDRCLAVQKTEKKYRCFDWTLPERVVHGFTYLDSAVLFAALEEGDTYYVYPVIFSGDQDCRMKAQGTMHPSLEWLSVLAEYSPKIGEISLKNSRVMAIRLDGNITESCQVLADRTTRPLRVRQGSAKISLGFVSGKEKLTFRFFSDFSIEAVAVLYRSLTKL